MGCAEHDMIYEGLLNIFNGEILLKVIELWKCRKCGATRVSVRGPGTTSSTEGTLKVLEPSEGRRWMVLISRGVGSVSPDIFVIPVRAGDSIKMDSPVEPGEELVIDRNCIVLRKKDLNQPRHVAAYLLEDLIRGYIDISTWPPSVYSLKTQSR
jgi:hypothetical protein